MKMRKIAGIAFSIFAAAVLTMIPIKVYAQTGDTVDIVFTSDMHSFIKGYDKVIDGEQMNIGGMARLKTFIDGKRSQNPETLVVDCGDFTMGTLSQAVMNTEAAELKFLADFGYDSVTYGNHEFDYGAQALSDMFELVADSKESYPAFVICNIDWSQNDEYTNTLKQGMTKYGFSDYVIVEKNGVKIAITGVLGYDAQKCSPTCELTFIDPITAVKDTVEKIKKNENPDMIVCLSHSGTGEELGNTEDEVLAKEVPDLDVIISGHSHTVLKEGITIGDTHILSCGAYTVYTGDISFTRKDDGRWNMDHYELVLMNESIKEDEAVLSRLSEIDNIIDEQILSEYGFKSTDVVAYNDGIVFEDEVEVYEVHTDMKLCSLLTDSYRYIANTTPEGRNTPFDVSVVPSGTVRAPFAKGDITVADAFRALSLGKGPDGKVGYPLVSLYLTGKELKTVVEIDASISDLMKSARLFMSGISFEYNPKRMLLNKTIDSWMSPAFLQDSRTEIENDKLYHIVTDSYSMSMLGAVTDMSKGLLSVVPKDADGNEITNPADCIIYDDNGNELKAWIAVVDYLESFSHNEQGVSQIPEYYNEYHGRKAVNASLSPRAMFKNTSRFFYIVVAIILLLVIIVVFVIRTIIRAKHKKKVFK